MVEKKGKKGIGHMTYPGVKVEEVPDKDPFDSFCVFGVGAGIRHRASVPKLVLEHGHRDLPHSRVRLLEASK